MTIMTLRPLPQVLEQYRPVFPAWYLFRLCCSYKTVEMENCPKAVIKAPGPGYSEIPYQFIDENYFLFIPFNLADFLLIYTPILYLLMSPESF